MTPNETSNAARTNPIQDSIFFFVNTPSDPTNDSVQSTQTLP